MLSCPSCGAENREGARFCDSCGAALSTTPPARESRRTVTVVFCDVTGSTALGERLDPESLRDLMTRYFDAMRAVLERHGGTVEKFIGDAVMAVFGIPKLHEDDPLRAVRAAAEMRSTLAELNASFARQWNVTMLARIGVNTGETVVGDHSTDPTLVLGDAVNVAARLEQAAAPGEILVGASTYRLVRDAIRAERLVPLAVKGKAERLSAYRLIDVEPEGTLGRQSAAPLVGRERELRLIADAYAHAVSDEACHLVTILGVAGVGKSRLVAEAVASLSPRATVLTGRCLPYGDGITFWPVAEIVRQAAGISESESADGALARIESLVGEEEDGAAIAAGVAELIGLAPPGASLEEDIRAVRRLLETLARLQPLVVAFDDLQWAEPALLDLIEHIADWSRGVRIVLLGMARPEFLELRPGWGGGKMNAVSLLLEPLGAAESGELVGSLLAGAEVEAAVRSKVLQASGGNPLFVEELVASLIEDGVLARDGDTWRAVGDLSAHGVPPTIQALLAARLDRLAGEELTVIEGASVVGQVFYRGAVSELAPESLRPDVGTYLLSLVRKDLVRPDRSILAGEEGYKFRHLLIRDAAYQAVPKRIRAELHERFARWLERTAGERLPEYEEIVAYHLEQAFQYRRELASLDEEARALGTEAGRALGRAGVRAAKRADFPAAASLLERATMLAQDDPDAVDWLMRLARARHSMGDAELAKRTYAQAVTQAQTSTDEAMRWRATLAYQRFLVFVDPQWSSAGARALAMEAIPALERLEDNYGLALAWRLLGDAEAFTGQFEAWGRACEQVCEFGRRAGDRELEVAGLCELAETLSYGPTPVTEAIERCRQIAGEGETLVRFWTLREIAMLEAKLGHFAVARDLLAEARAGFEELGLRGYPGMQGEYVGRIELLAGDPVAAAEGFRTSFDDLQQGGELGADLAIVAALLAEALYRQGRDEEAEVYARVSETAAPPTDTYSQSRWKAIRGKILARRGELSEAASLARKAVETANMSDLPELRGDVLMDLAEVLHMAGRDDEALKAIHEALALYERKGNVVSAHRAQSLLGEPSSSS